MTKRANEKNPVDGLSALKTVFGGQAESSMADIMGFLKRVPLYVDSNHMLWFMSGLLNSWNIPEARAEMNAMSGQPELLSESPYGVGESNEDGFWDESFSRWRPYKVEGGVLTIPVMGSLTTRGTFSFGSSSTGYEYIRRATERGMADDRVEAIMLNIHSPGGMAHGCMELSRDINAFKGRGKKITSMLNNNAFSAAYALASAADEIVIAEAGESGSVGVISMHVNLGGLLEQFGIDISLLYRGKHKVDGNPFEPLSEGAMAEENAELDKFYASFVERVANNRNMSNESVRGTEARIYDAKRSLEIGFADRIGSWRIEHAEQSRRTRQMSKQSQKPEDQPDGGEQSVDADSIRKEERARFASVQSSPEYAGREQLATKLLGDTEMSAETIISMLATAERKTTAPPPESPDASATATATASATGTATGTETPVSSKENFSDAMNKSGNPDLLGDDHGDERSGTGADETAKQASQIVAAGKMAGVFSAAEADTTMPGT